MSPDTKIKLAELSELSIGQLAAKYEKLFGERYKSLTAVARAITGSHCNGFHFFKLGQSK